MTGDLDIGGGAAERDFDQAVVTGFGAVRPGRSSTDGGIEEFPELREINRSSRASRCDNS